MKKSNYKAYVWYVSYNSYNSYNSYKSYKTHTIYKIYTIYHPPEKGKGVPHGSPFLIVDLIVWKKLYLYFIVVSRDIKGD
jgi:hypothetical protein